jgi:Fe-S-cluster containining protein
MTFREATARLDAVYATLPTIACQGHCATSCGPLALSVLERTRVQRQTPWKRLQGQTTLDCPLLRQGRCTQYAVRPLLCRLYGVATGMPCRYGCMPERWVSDTEVEALLHVVEEISQTLFPGQGTCSFHALALFEPRGTKGSL